MPEEKQPIKSDKTLNFDELISQEEMLAYFGLTEEDLEDIEVEIE